MKVLLFTDNHFCKSSSILNRRGKKYFERLENQISSINWLEKLAVEKGCQEVWCLGDFFNKPDLEDEVLTALKDIKWNSLPHRFIVGNHESSQGDLKYNSVKALEKENFEIIYQVENKIIDGKNIVFVPYFSEFTKVTLGDLFVGHADIVLSHNAIAGIQMGTIITTLGFELNEILSKCDLFINGHLHNGGWVVNNRILNLGSLTGQNFTEDAFKHSHCVAILDTNTLSLELIENPYAYNFYKVDIATEKDLEILYKLKNNAVVWVRCAEPLVNDVQIILQDESKRIINSRVIISHEIVEAAQTDTTKIDLSVNPVEKFIELSRIKFVNTKVLEEELAEICK